MVGSSFTQDRVETVVRLWTCERREESQLIMPTAMYVAETVVRVRCSNSPRDLSNHIIRPW